MYAKLLLFTIVSSLSSDIDLNDELYYAELPEIIVSESISDDTYLIAKVIFAEGSKNTDDYLAIGEVIMNRCKKKQKSIKQIIFQKNQFNGVGSKKWKSVNTIKNRNNKHEKYQWNRAIESAKLAISGSNTIPDNVVYFHNKKIATNTKWVAKLKQNEYKKIGEHTFCFSFR